MLETFTLLASVFLVGLLLPTFPFLPLRLIVLIPLAAATIHPLFVTLVASIATSIGTWPLYGVFMKSAETRTVRRWLAHPSVQKILQFFDRKMFLVVVVFGLLPLPDQLMSAMSGVKRYPAWKMMLGFFLGRLPYFLLLAYIGSTHRSLIERTSHWFLRSVGW